MATRKRQTDGADNGENNGESNGLLDFDTFCDRVKEALGGLHPMLWVAGVDAEGRTIGERLGKIALEPVDTLDDRLEEQWPGPRRVSLRTKDASTGHWSLTGWLPIPAPRAAPVQPAAATSSDIALLALVEQMKQQQAQIAELSRSLASTQAAPPTPKLGEQVGALDSLAGVLQRLLPTQSAAPAAKGMTVEDFKEAMKLGQAMNGAGAGDSLAIKALETFKESGNSLVQAVAGLLAAKAMNVGKADVEAAAAAEKDKAE